MLKMNNFPFFGDGMAHGDATISVSFADMIRHSALALFGRTASGQAVREAQVLPADTEPRDETGRPVTDEENSWFEPSSHRSSRLPSDSPLRADIGLLPLDNF